MAESQTATTYPTAQQYERWKDRAKDFGMSVSEFIQYMVEAGLKKFDARVEADESRQELRQQRNDLKAELEHARDRINTLENRLHRTERETVRNFVQDHPGSTYEDVTQHVIDSAPDRVNAHLDALEGDAIETVNNRYYPTKSSTEEGISDAA
ncbi:hypothetical protein [Halobaculum sp. EA56]|uniref:hypothetical protein n=1 Tax=Halobaculum sp. EA56 TaxID=3421648 RepID=UPI003EC03C9B